MDDRTFFAGRFWLRFSHHPFDKLFHFVRGLLVSLLGELLATHCYPQVLTLA